MAAAWWRKPPFSSLKRHEGRPRAPKDITQEALLVSIQKRREAADAADDHERPYERPRMQQLKSVRKIGLQVFR